MARALGVKYFIQSGLSKRVKAELSTFTPDLESYHENSQEEYSNY